MSVEDNKALTRRFYTEINQGNAGVIDELISEDFVEHEGFPGLPSSGREAPRAFFELFKAAFPDFQITPDEVIGEGDKVVVRATMSGTHKGEFMGAPPTGKGFKVEAIDIVEVHDGQATAHWGQTDQVAMMEQLGLAPEM
jgi:steroid delta-isomerase-like uncharacterized protein